MHHVRAKFIILVIKKKSINKIADALLFIEVSSGFEPELRLIVSCQPLLDINFLETKNPDISIRVF